MTDFVKFKRQVEVVHNAANIVIANRNAKVRWPELEEEDRGVEGKYIAFKNPAVLWDAPLRKTGVNSRARRAIVMDGHFYFDGDIFNRGGAHLEVYSTHKSSDGRWEMKLIETMHFDFEYKLPQTAFHPMFHVQFGKSKRLDEAVIATIVCELARIKPDQLRLDRSIETDTRDVRIPTPQMDYMSVLAMVIADYFCDSHCSSEVTTGFITLLRKVMLASNPARSSRQSKNLEQRWNPDQRGPFCASHWYAESHR